ncbi:methylmalonyl-CoA carboxyltransferase, partial [Candidatus Woesearchaeota archaeon]|nr:methylmalonyl-CoA carboxyltransferase [Candidatus Woesearchaeota archaeon]
MGGNKVKEFLDRQKAVQNDRQAIELQHKKGKLTARERLKYLFDADSFVELGAFAELQSKELEAKKNAGDGVITGYGTISKKPVYAYAQDFSFMGGSMGEMH